ncbi:MAG: hypothetical protein P8Y69_18535 [Gammaproteobacteria bacterium]
MKKLKIAVAVVGSFLGLIALIYYLALEHVVTPQVAGLMAVALFGMYVGFGILILAYRVMSKLQ